MTRRAIVCSHSDWVWMCLVIVDTFFRDCMQGPSLPGNGLNPSGLLRGHLP